MLKRSFFSVLFLYCCLVVPAQNTGRISGKVADSLQRPLEGATILVAGSNNVAVKTALSDDKGAFVLEKIKPGTYRLIVSMSGFRKDSSIEVAISEEKNIANVGTVKLESLPKGLQVITVTAQRPEI